MNESDESGSHEQLAVSYNNDVWRLFESEHARRPEVRQLALLSAYASAFHWELEPGKMSINTVRLLWLISRAWAVVGNGEECLRYARLTFEAVNDLGVGDFDLAYAHEALARAYAALGRFDEARVELTLARSIPIKDPQDVTIFTAFLESEPWFGIFNTTP